MKVGVSDEVECHKVMCLMCSVDIRELFGDG